VKTYLAALLSMASQARRASEGIRRRGSVSAQFAVSCVFKKNIRTKYV